MKENSELIDNIFPNIYDLKIYIDPEANIFKGYVAIFFTTKINTKKLILHSKNLKILKINLFCYNEIMKFNENKNNETIIIEFEKIKTPGNYKILILYESQFTNNMVGFYKIQQDNSPTILATQAGSKYARMILPCFDEPKFKAIFRSTIITYDDIISPKIILSNTNIKNIKINKTKKITEFEDTPKMCSYLLAFVIGNFKYVEEKISINNRNILVRVFGLCDENKLLFALKTSTKALIILIEWLNMDYSFSKLDLVALPELIPGAMENWGLVTFRESLLICDSITDIYERQKISEIICHEIAHQWFGNLVSIKLWKDVWINEAFANYFSKYISSKIYPELYLENVYLKYFNMYSLAYENDGYVTSWPLDNNMIKSKEVRYLFDNIIYSKGCCIIMSIENYIGSEMFRKSLKSFVKKYQYNNFSLENFYSVFDPKIVELISPWIRYSGYPLITIDNNNSINQEKYFNSCGIFFIKYNKIWNIIFDLKNNYINSKKIGIFKTLYKIDVDIKKLSLDQKINILYDNISLSLTRYQDLKKPYYLINQLDLEIEDNFILWDIITNFLIKIDSIIFSNKNILVSDVINNTRKYVLNSLRKKNILFQNLNINNYHLREIYIKTLIWYEYRDLIDEIIYKFNSNKWIEEKNIILPYIGNYIDNCDFYNKLLSFYYTIDNVQIKLLILNTLSKTKNPRLIDENINIILTNKIKKQHILDFMNFLSYNNLAFPKLWDNIKNNWDKYIKLFPVNSTNLINLIRNINSGFMSYDSLNDYIIFFQNKEINKFFLNNEIEKIRVNICNNDYIKNYLQSDMKN